MLAKFLLVGSLMTLAVSMIDEQGNQYIRRLEARVCALVTRIQSIVKNIFLYLYEYLF